MPPRGRRPPPRHREAPPARRPPPDRGLGGDQVEGRQAVRELLAAGRRRVREVWFAADIEPAPILGEIEDLCQRRRVALQRVARGRLEAQARSEAPQGVLARAEPLRETDIDELCRPTADGAPPFLVALDGVTDPQNLGAVMRTAASAGATGIVLPRHRAVHVTPTVAKAAAGAIEYLPIAVVPGLPTALARARELGVWSVGLDAHADRSIFDVEVVTDPVLVVLGAEGAGLGRLTRQRCDVVAAIPLQGPIDSLNVSAAAAVACFEVARRRLG
jgi:23S rRNA (guanosine2251-2'-O)-methyltransferase